MVNGLESLLILELLDLIRSNKMTWYTFGAVMTDGVGRGVHFIEFRQISPLTVVPVYHSSMDNSYEKFILFYCESFHMMLFFNEIRKIV